MVLLEIDARGIALLPFECDAPGSVDGDRISHRSRVQRMKPPSRQAEIVKRFRPMERLQSAANALDEVGTDGACRIIEEEITQCLAAEAADHERDCKTLLDR
jgi:hypothetical protein